MYQVLQESGCPIVSAVKDRIRFESFLADLSATFINVPGQQVDAWIQLGLQKIVEFLRIDRAGIGQRLPGETSIAVTHSYQVEGVPPAPKAILESMFPVYARKIHEGHPFRLPEDIENIPEAAAEREYMAKSGLKSTLTIPLKISGIVLGGVAFSSFREKIEWADELIQRLRLVGDIFANALARQQADENLRTLASKLLRAQEEERRLLAREMHDDWTQRLAVLCLDVARLEKFVNDPAVAANLLRAIQGQLIALSGDVHDLSRQLHPAILDELGLVEALRSECAAFTRREGITVDYRADGVPRVVASELGICVYRVAQEALRNIARHAAVNRCWVTLSAAANRLELVVRDTGVGFDTARVRQEPGIGLASMQERVRLVGAKLNLTSAPGQGTTLVVLSALEGHYS
jgi:two-component system, NarL family, sensor kinase